MLLPLLMLQMFFLMFLLAINGEPLRFILLRRFKLFSDLDFIQICILDIYLAGLIFYLIAMLPFPLFNWLVIFCLTLLNLLLFVIIHFKALKSVAVPSKTRAFLVKNQKAFLDYVLVFAIFVIFLLVDLSALSNFVFGGIFDESIHSLKTQVILENNFVPLTLQPYLPEGIIYPGASHVIFAFASYALNIIVPEAVFYTTILFKSLSVFGAYFLGKKLSSGRIYSLGLSFVFAFISSWPLFVVWGGNPFLVGFPLFLICLGVLFSFIRAPTASSFAEVITIGLLFGFSGAIIVSYTQTLIAIAFIVLIFWFARKSSSAPRKLFEFIVILLVSLLVIAPFLFRFFAFYQYPGHNIGIPADFAGYPEEQFAATQALQWAFDNLSPYFEMRLLTLFLFVGFGILVWINRSFKNVKPIVTFASVIFIAAALLSFISFLLPVDFRVVSWGHQGIILMVPLNILILSFYVELSKLDVSRIFKLSHKFSLKGLYSNAIVILAIFTLITAPFLYHRILMDPQTLRGTYRLFAVTTQSDYELMMWMKENMSSNAVILVSLFEPGLFIPSISRHKIVYPYSASTFSRSYQTLLNLLEENVLNETVYDLLGNLSVSHIYVGSDGAYWWFKKHKWNPTLFLGNPNFELVKKFGNAYLFRLVGYNSTIAFLDNFEYIDWEQNIWQNNFLGKGLGNVTIMTDVGYNNSKGLQITAQAVPEVGEWELRYAYWVSREVFVTNNSDVMLSFYLEAVEGFGKNDTLAVLISDVYGTRSIVITTPNGVYGDYASAITLNSHHGLFDLNLSEKWQQTFNSSLPSSFILQFVNYDFDGIKNIAYVDNIEVTSRSVD
jgi:hypothetical protein